MRKLSVFLFLIVVIISACEKDDFCTQNPVTTNLLILRFYDVNDKDNFKDVKKLSIWAEGKDTLDNYISIDTDSIAIPLNSNSLNTIYHLKMNTIDGAIVNNVEDTFTINYTTENEYVSRSCGFKVNFLDLTLSSSNNWISSFNQIETIIDDQNTAHVQVFH